MSKNRSWFFLEIIFIVGCIFFNVPKVELSCAGIPSPFDILPKGDHKVEYGSTLDLYCKLNKSFEGSDQFDSKDLKFYILSKKHKYNLSNTTILNETTIQLHLVDPPLGSTYYYCSLNDTKDCLTNVQVGYKPKPVLNFQCKSINWEKLVCTWTPPENPIKTVYRLTYSLTGRAGRTPRPCPKGLDVLNNSCIYDFETDPQYRQPYEYFSFELTGENELGNFSKVYKFHHFAHVIPNKPENVTVINKTEGSVVIGWNIPLPLIHFPPGLRFKIEYKNKWEDWVNVQIPESKKIKGKNYTYNITDLQYAHTPYDVRIYLKSSVAAEGPNDWSLPASIIFVTPSSVPSMAPSTTQGCFDIVSNGNDTDVFVYWARIPEKFENGDKFEYNVVCTKDNKKDCGLPIDKSMSYAKFQLSSQHSYSFTIYSVNEVGRSEDNSFVFISKYDSLIQPESFTKVAYDYGVFELSWKPVAHDNLSNYTIFWCTEDKDLPMPCRGYIDWVTVSKETKSKNITMSDVTKFYKFAISANFNDGSSSGMVWSSCVIFHDKVLKKVDDFHISRVGSREVDVVWEIRCAQSSAFKGFAFFYCPVGVSLHDNSCTENTTETITRLNGSLERNITLTNLRPYTTYKLQISIISLDGSQQIQLGPKSITKRFDTLQDAPSVPYNLTAISVTNTSVTLKWSPPKEMNGVLQNYKLYREYLGVKNKIEIEARNEKNILIDEYEIKDLISFTEYNFTLKACTSIKCSDISEPAIVKTFIGIPGQMVKPQVSLISPTMADIAWSSPEPSAGFLDYYQVSIESKQDSTNSEVFNVTGLRGKVEFHLCEVKYKTEFKIRAINIDKSKNVTYFGPWSDPTEVNCGLSVWAENNVLINWISGSSTVIIVSACLFYVIKKGWLQCRKMKDVEVKLPPGLQSQDLEKDNQDYVHLERWPPRSPEPITGSGGTTLAPDEESLLDKKSDESMDITSFQITAKNGGDSSGCSVGRESVSSSITSDTHISSDSGAEPDQCIITSTPFELWNSGRNGNNVKNPSSKDILNFSGHLGGWNLSESAIPGYTKVGFTNCFVPEKNLPGKGYVTIASVSSINPQQLSINNNSVDDVSLERNDSGNNAKNIFSLDTGPKNVNLNGQLNSAGPKYVSLAHFESQKTRDSFQPGSHGNRSAAAESPKLSRLDETLEPINDNFNEEEEEGEEEEKEGKDNEDGNDCEKDSSGNETETENIHEVPLNKDFPAMPPYVSISETSCRIPPTEKESDEGEEEKNKEKNIKVTKNKEENKLLSSVCDESSVKKTVNGIENSLSIDGGAKKENVSFSNYIPHHIFGKEPVHNS